MFTHIYMPEMEMPNRPSNQWLEWFCHSFRLDFFLLVLVLFLVNVPFWDNRVFLLHDALCNFDGFYFFYNEFFHHHEIARWVPYGMYGMPSDILQMPLLTPAGYLFGLLGWLVKVKNAFLLFKISVFFEQLTFLAGTYLLSRILFRRPGIFLFSPQWRVHLRALPIEQKRLVKAARRNHRPPSDELL